MSQKSSQFLKQLSHIRRCWAPVRSVLFGFRKNWTSYSARSPLIHSYGYVRTSDRTDYLARFPLKSESFMNYPG